MNRRRIALSIHNKISDAIEAGDAERARASCRPATSPTAQNYFNAADPEQRAVAFSPQALARRKH